MNRITRHGNAMALIYGAAATMLCMLFVGLLRNSIMWVVPEHDLWWMVPTLSHHIEGKTAGDLLAFLFSPVPRMLGQPVVKIFLYLGVVVWGASMAELIVVAMAVHMASTFLLYVVCQQLGMTRRVSACSALVYLALFAQFHAYMWPPAFQHPLAVFTILGVLSLYLKTERLGMGHPLARRYFLVTLAATLAASLQRSTIIAPAMILTHILFCSENRHELMRRYDRWLPLFVLHAVYPIISLTFAGDVILTTEFSEWSLAPGVKAIAMFLGVVAVLLGLRILVRTQWPNRWPWIVRRALPVASLLALWVLLSVWDHRQVLLPYNALLPFISVMTSFLNPLRKALAMDSTEPLHNIAPQGSVANVLLAVLLIAVFVRIALAGKRSLLLWLIWYAMTLYRFWEYSFLIQAPSRYFIYLSPVFAVIFCTVFIAGYDVLMTRTRLKPLACELLVVGLVVSLCVPNLLAVRLASWRGRLANNYRIYDDLRTAHLIREDLRHEAVWRHIPPEAITVQNVSQMPVEQIWPNAFINPADYGTFRRLMEAVFRDRAMQRIDINVARGNAPSSWTYVIDDVRIRNGSGLTIDTFGQLFDDAISAVRRDRKAEALELFQQAIKTRPFLLQYVFGSGGLDDVRWVTNGTSLRPWIHEIADVYRGWSHEPVAKFEQILALMDQELAEYALCLLYSSYLQDRAGEQGMSRHWLSQMRFLEHDPKQLADWLRESMVVREDPAMLAYLEQISDTNKFPDPLPWRMDHYGFERFLARFVLNQDVRAGEEPVAEARTLREHAAL